MANPLKHRRVVATKSELARYMTDSGMVYVVLRTGAVKLLPPIDAWEAIQNGVGTPIMPHVAEGIADQIGALLRAWGPMEPGAQMQALSAYLKLEGIA